MKLYNKKDKISKAILFDGSKESFQEIQAWVGSQKFKYDYQKYPTVFLKDQPVPKNTWIVFDAKCGAFKRISNKDFQKALLK